MAGVLALLQPFSLCFWRTPSILSHHHYIWEASGFTSLSKMTADIYLFYSLLPSGT